MKISDFNAKNNLRQIFSCKISINLPPKTKLPTVEMKPDKKELNGKVPTKQQ